MDENRYPLRAIPGYYADHPGIQIGTYVVPDSGDDELRLLRQLGVDWAMITPYDRNKQSLSHYRAFKERLADHGLKIYRIHNESVHNSPEITLNLPGRDEKVEEFIQFIRDIAAVGIYYNTYAHMANGTWNSGVTTGRGGAEARHFDLKDARGSWDGVAYEGAFSHGREYSEEEIWDNYEYFIRKIAPVAEQEGVYIGIHPDDPPIYPLGGVPRCIFGGFEGYKRALEIADSPNIGVCLCVGCWLEGGAEAMGASVEEAIRFFGGQGKLFKVHFRNVSNPLPEPWRETFIDDGYYDMYRVMQALRDVGFDGCVIPDHIPAMVGGPSVGLAYSIAYLRALVQAAQSERGEAAERA